MKQNVWYYYYFLNLLLVSPHNPSNMAHRSDMTTSALNSAVDILKLRLLLITFARWYGIPCSVIVTRLRQCHISIWKSMTRLALDPNPSRRLVEQIDSCANDKRWGPTAIG